jgi:hypothetical protein
MKPTPEEQLSHWAAGVSVCPNTAGECCPDFSCCRPALKWSADERARFMSAGQGEREKMMMRALGALAAQAGHPHVYVTRGNPSDRK